MISNHLSLVEQHRQYADSMTEEQAARVFNAVGAWHQVKVDSCAA